MASQTNRQVPDAERAHTPADASAPTTASAPADARAKTSTHTSPHARATMIIVIALALAALIIAQAAQLNDAFGWATIAIPTVLAASFWALERKPMPLAEIGIIVALVALACVLRFLRIPIQGLQFTSWLVILTGISLGAESGFLAGALIPFISNFWLGQGAWTPWQMLAWGLLGALAGWLMHAEWARKPWAMALFGLLSGWAYGLIMNIETFLYLRQWSLGVFGVTIAAGIKGDTLSGISTGVLLFISIPWATDLIRRVYQRNSSSIAA